MAAYELLYLDRIPAHASVSAAVDAVRARFGQEKILRNEADAKTAAHQRKDLIGSRNLDVRLEGGALMQKIG